MRVNIHFLDNGTKVSYTQPKSYVFERHLSVGDDNDTFVSVDIPILVSKIVYIHVLQINRVIIAINAVNLYKRLTRKKKKL